MNNPEPTIRVNVDVTNPGQFFACCGLLELADRLWPGAEGWFEVGCFEIRSTAPSNPRGSDSMLATFAASAVCSSMSSDQTARLKSLKNLNKLKRTAESDLEASDLNSLWERERLCITNPFEIWLDWWNDDYSGGGSLKTWAGKQFISDIVASFHKAMQLMARADIPTSDWLDYSANSGGLPLYFDSDIGGHSTTIDVGFSLDKVNMRGSIRPMLEMLAFIGLQRFRPRTIVDKSIYRYSTWSIPATVLLASVLCNRTVTCPGGGDFEFQLLYRTKYLKGFLPAIPVSGE